MDVSQYLEIFIDETKEHLQNLNDCILTLEQEPDNMDTVNEIFRAAHSLKGMAGTMGYKRMQKLTHDMENVFQEVRSGNKAVSAPLIDIVFDCLDALESYLDNIQNSADEGTDDNQAIIDRLNQILSGEEAADSTGGQEEAAQETEAGQKSEEGSGDAGKEKFLDVVLNEEEKKEFQDQIAKGLQIIGVTVYVEEGCLLKAARAFIVFKSVEEIGEIIKFSPSSNDIEDEKFDNYFSFFLAVKDTDNLEGTIEKITTTAKNVSEIADAFAAKIPESMYAAGIENPEEASNEASKDSASAKQGTAVSVQEKKKNGNAPAANNGNKPAKKNTGKQGSGKPVVSRTVRVDIEKLDALMNQVSELIIAKNSLVSISNVDGGGQSQGFHDQIEYLERITTNIHESVMKVRMVPIESVVNKYPRMIRDLTKKLDKKMELYMTGEDTELDRTVVDEIGDPLQHLLRNSADHGLEPNDVRVEKGKPEVGSIHLDAFQEGNNVIIEVSDDGNGIDTESVKNKAIERGIISEEQAEAMSQKEIIDLLFLPSFSMAKKITDVSGRGVGLDVVKSKIESLGGDVEVKSVLGEGSKFTIRLPLTLAIIQALMVTIRDEKYAIALGSIQTIEDVPKEDIKSVEAKEVIHLRGMVIPIIRMDKILDIPPKEEEDSNLTVVIVHKGENFAGLVIDQLIGQQEIVIKSLGKYIENNKIISGATILGDGEVALIIDVNALI